MAVRPTLFTFDNNGLTSPDGGNVIINPTGTIDSAVSLAIDEISGGGGGTGGGSVKNVIGGEIISISDTPKNPIKAPVETIPGVSTYTIRIGANITGATIFINNEQIAKTTPTNLTISKVDLLKGPKTITIKKEGYFSFVLKCQQAQKVFLHLKRQFVLAFVKTLQDCSCTKFEKQ